MYDLYHAIHKDSASMYAQTYISCQQSSVAYMVEYVIIWAINLGGSLVMSNLDMIELLRCIILG
jgi:hypothetical protein